MYIASWALLIALSAFHKQHHYLIKLEGRVSEYHCYIIKRLKQVSEPTQKVFKYIMVRYKCDNSRSILFLFDTGKIKEYAKLRIDKGYFTAIHFVIIITNSS